MNIKCPHCHHPMELKGAKPGEFHPRCPACKKKFRLVVPSDASAAPTVSLEIDQSAETLSPAVAHALGVDAKAQAKSADLSADSRRAARAGGASTRATMPPASDFDQPPRVTRSSINATSIAPVEHTPQSHGAPSQIDEAPPYGDDDPVLPGQLLGGYQISRKLGQGGMGAVYLARQISLDRDVALKVLSPNLARDPQFVARFAREAYAAAQLTHHNVVQIHDIGAEENVNFFSMEYVQGKNLAHLLTEHGKLDIEQAVGFTLQAARGLKYAHDHGLIHRDIKPENLLLNDAGIVKVADLGLVKRANTAETKITMVGNAKSEPGSPGQTQLNMSMGTPAYMSPEQAQDAAHVDQRADIYSLGCTLYDLITGRPPFVGRTALEVITKHLREPITPPDVMVKNVPRTLSIVLMKMIAKKPDHRYQSMGELIGVLEDFLGVATTGPFTPKQEHVDVLETSVAQFNNSKWSMIRRLSIYLFFVVCAALAIFVGMTRGTVIGKVQWTGAFIGLAVLTTLAYTAIVGQLRKTTLFIRLRQLVFGASFGELFMWTVGAVLVLVALYIFSQLVGWLAVAGIAVVVALAFYFLIDRALSNDRNTPIVQTEAMLKQMRLRGLDENSLRQFVCKYSGKKWEEFYEALFGFEAKLQARQLWGRGDRGQARPKFAAWREPIIRAIELRLSDRRELRERKVLARIEAKALRAKGIGEGQALREARNNARRMVDRAGQLRSTSIQRAAATMAPTANHPSRITAFGGNVELEGAMATLLRGGAADSSAGTQTAAHKKLTDEDTERDHESWFKRRYGTPLDLICGPMVRFVLAVIVLITFTVWFKQNSGERVARDAADVLSNRREVDASGKLSDWKARAIDAGNAVKQTADVVANNTGSRPLRLFPGSWETINHWTEPLGGWNAALGGLLLLVSVLFKGRLLAVSVVIAALVAMFGHHVTIPVIGFVPYAWMSAAAGALLWVFGVMFFRDREGY